MAYSPETIFDEAMSLSPDRRAALAEKLLASLDEKYRAEIDIAWAQEAERRLEALDRGEVQAIPGDDVMRCLEAGNKP